MGTGTADAELMLLLMPQSLKREQEFQLTFELISGPLTLLVALWGMTSERIIQAFRVRSFRDVAVSLSTR